jgi:thiazole synthase
MRVIINGEERRLGPELGQSATLAALLTALGLDARKIALERNSTIIPRSAYADTPVRDGDRLEIVHFIGGGGDAGRIGAGVGPVVLTVATAPDDRLLIGGRAFRSRLIVGTGKYRDFDETRRAVEASGAEMVTVAVRRVNLSGAGQPMLVDFLDPKKYVYLPNTAGCYTGEEAVRTLRLARDAGGWTLVKLEVLGDKTTLYPDMPETLRAAELLVREGFDVMVYCSDDPIQAKRLEEIGCVAIMPLAAPIGSGLGVQNPVNIRIIVENAKVPVIVDAGVGTASDATIAMELGCDGVLMNTAIAEAKSPILMAGAMKLAVESGRLAYLAGRMAKKRYADPSSPLAGLL